MRNVLRAVIMMLMCSPALLAQNQATIDFEQLRGPSSVTACSDIKAAGATFSGGQIVTGARDSTNGIFRVLVDQTTLYGTRAHTFSDPAGVPSGCSNGITITFDEPVSFVRLRLLNGIIFQPFFVAFDGRGTFLVKDLFDTNQTLLSFPDSGIQQITVIALTTQWYFGIDDITFTRAGSNFRLKATTIPPNGAVGDTEERQFAVGDAAVTEPFQFNLGELFDLKLVQVNSDGLDGAEVPIESLSFKSQSVGNPPIPSDLFSNPTVLFPSNVLIPFTSAPTQFFPIHSGTATLSVTFTPPGASSQKSVDVQVQVNSSGFLLGAAPHFLSDGTSLDDLVLGLADLRGIPPQILKAQIQQESSFNTNAYRYEPLTSDFKAISTKFFNRFQDLRATDGRFVPYRMQTFADSTDDALPQGSRLIATELGLRERFLVVTDANNVPIVDFKTFVGPRPTSARAVTAADAPIAMENILLTNTVRRGWISASTGTFFKYLDFRVASKPFTAQTVLAASYGLMQVLYTTSVVFPKYVDDRGIGLQPSGLFETKTSVDVGSQYLAFLFRRSFRGSRLADAPSFISVGDLNQKFGVAVEHYNRGPFAKVDPNDLQKYATDILSNSSLYFPSR